MDPDRLASYPWVIVRIACRRCKRHGAYRLARLTAKFGSEMPLEQVLLRLSYDCPWHGDERNKASNERCEAMFPGLGTTDAARSPARPYAIAGGSGREGVRVWQAVSN